MHEITYPTSGSVPPRRWSRFVTRWAAATLVMAAVFVGARHTVGTDTSGPAEKPTSLAPKAGTAPTDASSEGWGTFDDAAPDDDVSDADLPDDAGPALSGTTLTATGSSGSGWSIQYPDTWTENDLGDGLVVFDAPDQPNVAMVRSQPLLGDSFEDQARQELDALRASLGDTELADAVSTTIDGRPVEQAGFFYTNPSGEPAAVWVTWILDGDTVHLVAGEVPTADDALVAEVEDTLNTFRINSTA